MKRVALLVETSTLYGRRILAGVAEYQKTHARWSTYLDERELRAELPTWMLQHKWDGMICRSTTPELAKIVKRKKIPVIDLNDQYDGLGLPRIQSDMHAIGSLAAAHLFERGFRRFAFCGFSDETWSAERLSGFRNRLKSFGADCELFESAWRGRSAPKWEDDQQRIARWIAGLPKPVGLMACNDIRGQHVLNACQQIGLHVPEQLAVIGVDNDELLCNFNSPPLSSVEPNSRQIGFAAAELLDELMAGKASSSAPRLIEPLGIVVRQSTDAIGIEDQLVVEAIACIRESACLGITVEEVSRQVGTSRSSLERRFRLTLGHSPQSEIRRTQLCRIKELLSDTDLPLADVAQLTGFKHTEYMTVVFKRLTGMTPSGYRQSR